VSPTSQSGGFQWGDAGIGAACMLVLVSAGAGLVVTARRRSHRQGLAVS
jgi:NADP-dependent 3-hydroxy acid dehydrogenase YdfG